MSQNLSQNDSILRQTFATASYLDADPAPTGVAKLRRFATDVGYVLSPAVITWRTISAQVRFEWFA
jgi:hypothetical protein